MFYKFKYLRFLYLISTLFFFYCTDKSTSTFDYSNLSSGEEEVIIKHIDSLQKANVFFKTIIEELENSENPIVFSIKNDIDIACFVPDKETGGGNIYFRNIARISDESAFIEEFFHAFQYSYYGKNSMIKNEYGEIIGGPNYEYEAKLMKAIINVILNYPSAEMPSQKGLLDFVLSLMDEKDCFSLIELSGNQHKQYIGLVRHFQQHWKQRNTNEVKNNIYDDPIIENLGPRACLHILRMNNTKDL